MLSLFKYINCWIENNDIWLCLLCWNELMYIDKMKSLHVFLEILNQYESNVKLLYYWIIGKIVYLSNMYQPKFIQYCWKHDNSCFCANTNDV